MGEQTSRYRRDQFRQEMFDRGHPFYQPERWVAPQLGIRDKDGNVHFVVKAI